MALCGDTRVFSGSVEELYFLQGLQIGQNQHQNESESELFVFINAMNAQGFASVM